MVDWSKHTNKEIEAHARFRMNEMKDLGEDWGKDYIIRNCPDMARIIERGKNKGKWKINWDGEVTLEELIGNGNPRRFNDTECDCFFVRYLDWYNGTFRIGKAVGFTRHKDGTATVRVKTPEDFKRYGDKEEEIIPGIITKRKYKKRKSGDANHINLNNILWALPPRKPQRLRGGKENRFAIIAGKLKVQRKDSKADKSKGKKGKAQKGVKMRSKRSAKPRGKKK